jgi:hydrogenase small subunit
MGLAAFMGNPSNTQPDPADDFVRPFRQAAEGDRRTLFHSCGEGRFPMSRTRAKNIGHALGTGFVTGQPITTCDWIDRLAANAWVITPQATSATYGGNRAVEGNPAACMGLPDLEIQCRHPERLRSGVSRSARQHDGTILYLLFVWLPMIPLDEALRPKRLFGSTLHEGCIGCTMPGFPR